MSFLWRTTCTRKFPCLWNRQQMDLSKSRTPSSDILTVRQRNTLKEMILNLLVLSFKLPTHSLSLSSSFSLCLSSLALPSFPHGVIMVNKTQCKHKLVYILRPWCWFLVLTGLRQIGQERGKANAVETRDWSSALPSPYITTGHTWSMPDSKGLHQCLLYTNKTTREKKKHFRRMKTKCGWKCGGSERSENYQFPCSGTATRVSGVIWAVIGALLHTWLDSLTHSMLCAVACWC